MLTNSESPPYGSDPSNDYRLLETESGKTLMQAGTRRHGCSQISYSVYGGIAASDAVRNRTFRISTSLAVRHWHPARKHGGSDGESSRAARRIKTKQPGLTLPR